MWWRRLLKWIFGGVAVLAIVALIVVWGVFGVNPLEGRVDHLWDLVSHEVHLFIRFPGLRVLEEDLVEGLSRREGFYQLANMADQLTAIAAEIEQEVNPQIPLGLFEVDLKEDLLRKEMALAGRITDYRNPRFDYFIALARVPFYGRFVSALKREFVSSKIQGTNIEVVKGLYLRVRLDAVAAEALKPYRTVMARPEGDDVIFVGRIKDVVLVSDNDVWIEHALTQSNFTLPADAWFETEFIETARGGRAIEIYINQEASQHFVTSHSRAALRNFISVLPPRLMGEVTMRVETHGDDLLTIDMTNRPPEDSLRKVDEYLQHIYEREKTNPSYELSEEGIGKFIPKDRTVGAVVMRVHSEDLVNLLLAQILPGDLKELDDMVRRNARTRFGYASFERMVTKLTENLGHTHLLIFHRPSVFDGIDTSTLYDPPDLDFPPSPQLAFTVVMQVKDSVSPQDVRDSITKHLPVLEMTKIDQDGTDGIQLAELEIQPEFLSLVEPTYGAMPDGMRYVYISTSREGAQAVLNAAKNPDARLLADEKIGRLRSRLPREASLAFVARGAGVKRHLLDFVRLHAENILDVSDTLSADIRREYEAQRKPVPPDQEITRMARQRAEEMYPQHKRDYERSLEWLDPIDLIMGTCRLGDGPVNRAILNLSISFDLEP